MPDTSNLDSSTVRLRLRQSLVWFPLVGGLIAGITLVVISIAEIVWPRTIAVLIELIIEARLTGAFHEDAVADFSDAMGGGLTRDDKLRIFKDSRIGAYGALSLVLAVAMRAALLVVLPTELLAPALIASGCFGRLTILLVMAQIAPIVGRDGLAKDIADNLSWGKVAIAALIVFPVYIFGSLAVLTVSLIVCFIFSWGFASLLRRSLGGSTGDCLGFAAYSGQLLTLLAFSARHL